MGHPGRMLAAITVPQRGHTFPRFPCAAWRRAPRASVRALTPVLNPRARSAVQNPVSASIVLECTTCDRRAASSALDEETLRTLTGYVERFGAHWCPECAAALSLADALED